VTGNFDNKSDDNINQKVKPMTMKSIIGLCVIFLIISLIPAGILYIFDKDGGIIFAKINLTMFLIGTAYALFMSTEKGKRVERGLKEYWDVLCKYPFILLIIIGLLFHIYTLNWRLNDTQKRFKEYRKSLQSALSETQICEEIKEEFDNINTEFFEYTNTDTDLIDGWQ
jgi:hypothetical protein